jgi:succinate-acetate transporter protein
VQQRHALGLLFLFLAVCFAGIAVAAARAGEWVIAVAGAVLGAWLATMAIRGLRPR